ncbi:MAG: L,D-transpeptidase family protein [Candidatus Eisenbacteria bacterium]|uniref:L,D-transpeptidase family protein n=1 Tax=Eiseniibacteriota bacterium TaxID=2212470 RepID=A0A7Y2H3C6_UNCEI|nr:L,D-transpeptidase family protein [Candidatus Eisenbacteria bacterium]
MTSLTRWVFGSLVCVGLVASPSSVYAFAESQAVFREPLLKVASESGLHAKTTVLAFYQNRGYSAAWSAAARPSPQAREMLAIMQGLKSDGLVPSNYHEARIGDLVARGGNAALTEREAAQLELLLTDAFIMIAAHLRHGFVDPVKIDSEWLLVHPRPALHEALDAALHDETLRQTVESFRPPQAEYEGLVRALAWYREIAQQGGWGTVQSDSTLVLGSQGTAVLDLRSRLRATGDLEDRGEALPTIDEDLVHAVRRFQSRHGLNDDGSVGPATRAALNVSVEDRLNQILVNLERWRWLPTDLGDRHVMVNIAAFESAMVVSGRDVLNMRVIAGRTYRRTPVFSGRIQYLVFNPSWSVPASIARKDLFPKFRKDPGEIARMGYRISAVDGSKVSPGAVDWSKPSAYRITQAPGPKNALGKVKFMFPNVHNVYLHDTSSPELFAKEDRAFSSGCIRVEKPMELAELLLEDSDWSPERVAKGLEAGKEFRVDLPTAVPVHILYWTAWVDRDGILQFRKDVYGRDGRVLEALAEPSPASPSR